MNKPAASVNVKVLVAPELLLSILSPAPRMVAGGLSVTPEAFAELGQFLQATSNRLASLEEMIGAESAAPVATE